MIVLLIISFILAMVAGGFTLYSVHVSKVMKGFKLLTMDSVKGRKMVDSYPTWQLIGKISIVVLFICTVLMIYALIKLIQKLAVNIREKRKNAATMMTPAMAGAGGYVQGVYNTQDMNQQMYAAQQSGVQNMQDMNQQMYAAQQAGMQNVQYQYPQVYMQQTAEYVYPQAQTVQNTYDPNMAGQYMNQQAGVQQTGIQQGYAYPQTQPEQYAYDPNMAGQYMNQQADVQQTGIQQGYAYPQTQPEQYAYDPNMTGEYMNQQNTAQQDNI
ncbi:MAG: hypothetical protein K6C35_07320 [Eubacterium sp.]|nr:hypothetical protein [Eubacterium sp.]